MIDNYDSFTFNLVHYFRALGQQVVVHRNDQITLKEITALAPQYIVLSPGPCDPDSAGLSLAIINEFIGRPLSQRALLEKGPIMLTFCFEQSPPECNN